MGILEDDARLEVDNELAGARSQPEKSLAPGLEISGVTVPKVLKNSSSVWSALLDIPAACLEVVPELLENEGKDVPAHFVIGTYDLQKDHPDPPAEDTVQSESTLAEQPETASAPSQSQVRHGSLMLWQWTEDHA